MEATYILYSNTVGKAAFQKRNWTPIRSWENWMDYAQPGDFKRKQEGSLHCKYIQ